MATLDDPPDPDTGERRQLWCYAISAKRYARFSLDADGVPQIPDDGYSEHGLGHLLNPGDPGDEDREWIRTIWQGLICEDLGLPFIWPDWLDRPAMSRITASSPQVLRPLAGKRPTTLDRSHSISSSARKSCRSGTRSASIPSTFILLPRTPAMPGNGRNCAGRTSIPGNPSPSRPEIRGEVNAPRACSRTQVLSIATRPIRNSRAWDRMGCPAAGEP